MAASEDQIIPAFDPPTPAAVRQRVRQLIADYELDHDDEEFHAAEDELHRSVLAAIAAGALDPPSLARAALRTWQHQASRWYA